MKSRILRVLFLVPLLVPLSACPPEPIPPEPTVTPGVWLFTVDGIALALNLHADGSTETPNPLPPGADSSFFGSLTWVLIANENFTLTQISGAATWIYHGTLISDTIIINGTWIQTSGGSGSGTWFAEKL